MSSNKVLKKIRGFILDTQSNDPIMGARLGIRVLFKDHSAFTFKMLSTDKNGYFSFDITKLYDRAFLETVNSIYLNHASKGLTLIDNGEQVFDGENGIIIYQYPVFAANLKGPNDLSSSERKEYEKYREQVKKVNDELKEEGQSVNSNLTEKEILETYGSFNKLYWRNLSISLLNKLDNQMGFAFYLTAEKSAAFMANTSLPSIDNPDVLDREYTPKSFFKVPAAMETSCSSIAPSDISSRDFVIQSYEIKDNEHWIKEHRQSWIPQGQSLGEIAYSLALAPGESVNLSVVDWRRSDVDSRTEANLNGEDLSSEQLHNRDVQDSVKSAMKEEQSGWSVSGSVGAGGSSSESALTQGATAVMTSGLSTVKASVGGSYSSSSGSKNLTGSSSQRIADSVTQNSSFNRSYNSTVIVQSNQSVKNESKTRTVTNNNHCHALTIQYYEVNRNYKIVTEEIGRIKVLKIPFKKLVLTAEEDYKKYILANKGVLSDLLMNDEALAKSLSYFYKSLRPASVTPSTADDYETITSYSVYILLDDEGAGGTTNIYLSDGRNSFLLAEDIDDSGVIRKTFSGDELPIKIKISELKKMTITSDEDFWQIKDITLKAYNKYGKEALIKEDSNINMETEKYNWDINVATQFPAPDPVASSDDNEAKSNFEYIRDFISANLFLLSKIRWVSMDKDQRKTEIAQADQARFNLVENTILGFDGETAIYPVLGSSVSISDPNPEVRFLSMPSRGLFAETMLSNCSACEVKDNTKYWDWRESPVPSAPALAPLNPNQDYTKTAPLTPTAFPNNVITMQAPTTLPGSTGLADALNLMGKDVFKDMSNAAGVSKIIEGLNSGILDVKSAESLIKAVNGNGDANGKKAFEGKTPSQIIEEGKAIAEYGKNVGLSEQEIKELGLANAGGVLGNETPLPGAAAGQSKQIKHDVVLIPQPDKLSCWAASMAMMVSFRRSQGLSAEDLVYEVGRSLKTSYSWDMLEAVKNYYGFVDIELPSNTSLYSSVEQWFSWLKEFGPLWVTTIGSPSHAIVVSGIKGDMSVSGTMMTVLNPWDTTKVYNLDPIEFSPDNPGRVYDQTFEQFAADFGNMNLGDYGEWRILYLPKDLSSTSEKPFPEEPPAVPGAAPAVTLRTFTPKDANALVINSTEVATPTGLTLINWAGEYNGKPLVIKNYSGVPFVASSRNTSTVDKIIFHETGTRVNYYVNNNSIKYAAQFCIQLDGTVCQYFDALELIPHTSGYSTYSIGIEFVNDPWNRGGFALSGAELLTIPKVNGESDTLMIPSGEQLEALVGLVNLLKAQFPNIGSQFNSLIERPKDARFAETSARTKASYFLITNARSLFNGSAPGMYAHSVVAMAGGGAHSDGSMQNLYVWLRHAVGLDPATALTKLKELLSDASRRRTYTVNGLTSTLIDVGDLV